MTYKLKELHRELEEGTASSPTYRVAQAVAAWLASLDLDPSTIANYRFMAKHVTEGLGDCRLRDLTAKDVQAFLEELPLSTRSRKLVHKILRDSVQHAMIAGLAGRNVAAIVNTTPRGDGGRPSKALSVAQAEAVLNAAKGTRLEAYLALSLMTGIRTEEARALTWEHVDLDGDPAADPPVPPHVAVWRSVRAHGDTQDRAEQAHPGHARVRRRRTPRAPGPPGRRTGASRAAVARARPCLRQYYRHSPQRRECPPRLPDNLRQGRPGEGMDTSGAASLVREHALGRRRGDRGHLSPGRPFQHAHHRARLPARTKACSPDRRRADGPDLRPAIMNLAVSLAVR
jgi:integrase